jgi:hypothetical protein
MENAMHTFTEAQQIARPGQFITQMSVGPMAKIEDHPPGNWLCKCYRVNDDRSLTQVR